MKTLQLNLAYGTDQKEVTHTELTINYIVQGASNVYKDGLEGQQRRIFARIQKKLDDALDKKEMDVELEDAEFDMVKHIIDKVKFPANLSKYVMVLEEEIEYAAKEE